MGFVRLQRRVGRVVLIIVIFLSVQHLNNSTGATVVTVTNQTVNEPPTDGVRGSVWIK